MGKIKLTKELKERIIQLFKNGENYASIGLEMGLSETTVYRLLKRLGLKSKDRKKKPKVKPNYDKIGEKHNHLTIKDFIYDDKHHLWLTVTLCDCGETTTTTLRSVVKGIKKTCGIQKCKYHHELSVKNGRITTTGYEEILGSKWASWRIGAEKRKIKFKITIEDAWQIYLNQDRKCALTGLPITFHKKYKDDFQTASLDRIDSGKDYTKDNVQWVHKDINIMKGALPENKFKEYCKLVINNAN